MSLLRYVGWCKTTALSVPFTPTVRLTAARLPCQDDEVECTMIERRVLAIGAGSPFLTKLIATFQVTALKMETKRWPLALVFTTLNIRLHLTTIYADPGPSLFRDGVHHGRRPHVPHSGSVTFYRRVSPLPTPVPLTAHLHIPFILASKQVHGGCHYLLLRGDPSWTLLPPRTWRHLPVRPRVSLQHAPVSCASPVTVINLSSPRLRS